MDSPMAIATADLELTMSPMLSELGTVTRGTTYEHKPNGAPTHKSFALNSSGGHIELAHGTGARYVYFAMLQIDGGDAAYYTAVDFMQGGSVQCQLRWNSDTGVITLYRGDGVALLATSSISLLRSAFHWIKVDLTATETGRFRVWANQDYATALADSGAGVDTRATSTDGFDAVRFRQSVNTVTAHFSDIVVYAGGTTPPDGEQFWYCEVPTGDTAKADLTPSTGSDHYAMVDEDPASDSDYNSTATASQGDRYTHGTLAFTADEISGVMVVSRCTRDGAIIQGRTLWKSGATSANGATITLPGAGSYGFVYDIKGADPNTSADWAQADVEALETGVEFL